MRELKMLSIAAVTSMTVGAIVWAMQTTGWGLGPSMIIAGVGLLIVKAVYVHEVG